MLILKQLIKIQNIKRCYECDMCWSSATIKGEEVYLPPVGDWNSVNWEEVLTKCFPNGAKFYFVPDYLAHLWEKECGSNVTLIEDRDSFDYMWDNEKMVNKNKFLTMEERKYNDFFKCYVPCVLVIVSQCSLTYS